MARDRHEEHVTFRRSSLGIKGTFEGVLTTVESCVVSDELYNRHIGPRDTSRDQVG